MRVSFSKYHGTGNDFILIDNREMKFPASQKLVASLCHRHFGVGADGLMLLQNKTGYDFEMIYFNSDGNTSSMCGNGGRCITVFAKTLGVINDKAKFIAIDGEHESEIKNDVVKLKMNNVDGIEVGNDYFFLNTGSPHYVVFNNNVNELDVVAEGRKIRYNNHFKKEGTNVNFVQKTDDGILVRTYERGVEDETLSCGTGVTACSIVASLKNISTQSNLCKVKTPGGNLIVHFKKQNENSFSDIWLEGAATFVFKGEIKI